MVSMWCGLALFVRMPELDSRIPPTQPDPVARVCFQLAGLDAMSWVWKPRDGLGGVGVAMVESFPFVSSRIVIASTTLKVSLGPIPSSVRLTMKLMPQSTPSPGALLHTAGSITQLGGTTMSSVVQGGLSRNEYTRNSLAATKPPGAAPGFTRMRTAVPTGFVAPTSFEIPKNT